MTSKISTFILKLLGWKITGHFPHDLKKFIVVVMPHTSNWDFPLGLLVRKSLKSDIKYLAKSSLFKFPLNILFRALGGYPVVRSKSTNFVDAVINIFNNKEEFIITITPEGTRKKVKRLRSGFYYIGRGANVPIVMSKFDFSTKTVEFSKPYYLTDDKEKDFKNITKFFKGAVGKNPEMGFDFGE